LELFTQNFKDTYDPTLDQMDRMLKKGAFRVFVLKKEDLPGKRIAGMAMVSNMGKKGVLHIEYLAISDLCQGKGLGGLMLKNLVGCLQRETQSLNRGPKMLTLECEDRLIPFYSKFDFQNSVLEPVTFESEKNGKKVSLRYHLMNTPLSSESTKNMHHKKFMNGHRKLLTRRLNAMMKETRLPNACSVLS
jgi:GNAT superfamily N-acetyltransferase